MRVAILSYYSGISFRGAETFVHQLSNRLVKLGHEITVYQYGPELKHSDYYVDSLASGYFLPPFTYPVPEIIFPTNGRLQSVLAKYWAYKNHKKIIISGQSGPGWDDRLNLFTFPDVFVGLTDFQCKWAKSVNPRVKIVKIPNGVDTHQFYAGVKPISVDLPKPIVLYVAALESIKRHELLINAVAKTNASLLLVGTGSLTEELNAKCTTLLKGRFQIANFTHDEMPSVYAACDIFTYPTSPWESFGIAMLEAMSSGLAVVAGDDPIRREIVGEAGIFVHPENSDDYRLGLTKALEIDWGQKPCRQAKNFDWDKIALSYSEILT